MAQTISLVLLGGGVVLGGAAFMAGTSAGAPDHRPCEEARAASRPDTEQICASARSASSYHGVGPWVWIAGSAARRGPALADANGFRAPAAASGRGGFGATARGFFSSSSADSAGS